MNDTVDNDPRLYAIPDIHGHAKGEHKAFIDERPIALSARMLFLWFFHACRRGWPRFLMVTDHMNYLTFEDPAAINLVRRALKLAQAGDLYGAAETASVEVGHAAVVSEGLRRGMRYSIGAEVDNDPRSRPDAQNIVDAMKPDGMIRSVHFLTIDHPTHGAGWNWPFDNPEFADVYETVGTAKAWEIYMATLLDAVERLPGNIVGHFYVPALFGHWPDDATLEAYEDQIVDACEARGMAIELNTRFLYRNHPEEEKSRYLAAHRRLLVKCKAKNVGIAIGSDAHSPKDQGRGFATVLALLDECEINELVFPIAGRLARVALRVERKVEPPAVAPEASAPALEEKKAVRKPRTSEAPARSRDSSSKRDESYTADETAPAEEAAPAKAKPRAKRGTSRAAAAAHDAQDGVSSTPAEADGGEVDTIEIEAVEIVGSTEVVGSTEIEAAEEGSAEPVAIATPMPDTEPSAEVEVATAEAPSTPTDAEPVELEPLISEPVVAGVSSIESAGDRIKDLSGESTVIAGEHTNPVAREATEVDDVDEAGELIVVRMDDSPAAEPAPLADAPLTEDSPTAPASRTAHLKTAAVKSKADAAKVSPAKAKPATKKAAKAAPKAAAKKSAVKKSAVKKAPVKSAATKKVASKKTAPKASAVKKAGPKKSPAKKAAAKKTAPKRR